MKRTLLRDAQVITMAPTRPDAEWADNTSAIAVFPNGAEHHDDPTCGDHDAA